VRFRTGPDVPLSTYEPEGDLATEWEQPDEVTYVFTLHPNANFQNVAPVDGRAVTAEDVIYSFQRQTDLKVCASFLPAMATREAVNDKTLRLTAASPNADFIATLGGLANKVIAREVVDQYGDLKEAPIIGSGAWIFEEWVPSNVVRLRRNPDFFRSGLPYADELQILRIADQAAYEAAFRTGDIVTLWPSAGSQGLIYRVGEDMADVTVLREKANPTTLKPKGDAPPTSDIRVRQAIFSAINRQDIIDGIFDGEGMLAAGFFLPSDDWQLPESELADLLKQDIAKSNRLLQEAGVTDWNPQLKSFDGPAWTEMAQLMQPMLAEAGINTTIQACNTACVGEANFQRNFELLLTPEGQATSITADLQLRHKGGSPRNPTGIQDSDLDSLIDQQAQEFDEDRRRELVKQIQRRVIEVAGQIPVGNGLALSAVQPFLMNYFGPPYGEYSFYDSLWLAS
jgi:peptide/nickel transport system substrate-binding protein